MAGISSVGIGSGLDIGGLVSQLVAAEGTAKQVRLDRKETQLQAQLSAMGLVKSSLSTFQSSYLNLKLAGSFGKLSATSSNSSLFTATASGTNVAKTSYSVEVESLSQSQKLTTQTGTAITDTSTVVGTGTLTIDFGTYDSGADTYDDDPSRQVSIDITDGSLIGIRDAINDADAGVTASIINDGTSYQLVLSSENGADNTMRVSVSSDSDGNDTDNDGLSILTFDPLTAGTKNMNEAQEAQDAVVHIDGVRVTSNSNTISSAIDGVTLDLKSADLGNPATLTIGSNTSGLSDQVQSFVDAYNELTTTIKELTYYDSDSKDKGLMIGDGMLRSIESRMRSILNHTVSNPSDPRTKYNSFAMIGVTTNQDGTLDFDTTKFSAAVGEDLQEVRNLFAGGLAGTDESPTVNNLEFMFTPSGIEASHIGIDIKAAATHGMYTSGTFTPAATYFMDGSALSLKVDGQTAISISTLTGNLTTAQIADQLQSAINEKLLDAGQTGNVSVAFDTNTNQFSLTSNAWGSSSSIEITSVGGEYANMGFANQQIGYVSGNPGAGSYNMNPGDSITLMIDGGSAITVNSVSGAGMTLADIATALQTEINAELVAAAQTATVTVEYDAGNNQFSIISDATDGRVAVTATAGDYGAGSMNFGLYNPSTYTGEAFAATGSHTLDETNDTLSVVLDNGAEITVSLANGTYTEAQVASNLQTAINNELTAKNLSGSVTVNYTGSEFTITSANSGGAVHVTDAQGLFASDLGFSKYTAVRGTDVQGTIGGESATGDGQVLTGSGNVYDGMEVRYFGSTSTYLDRVSNVTGVLSSLDELLDSYLDADGIIAARNSSFDTQIEGIQVDRERLIDRLTDLEARYLKKFSAMDALVANLNATSEYLSNQLKNLPSPAKSNK